MVSVRSAAGRDDVDRHAGELLDAGEYRRAVSGSRAKSVIPLVGSFHPGSVSYTGSHSRSGTAAAALLVTSPFDAVAGGDAQRVEAVEHVELVTPRLERLLCQYRPAQRHRVEPAAAPGPAGDRAELVADAREVLAVLVRTARSRNGPRPTRVVYALTDASTAWMSRGPSPVPTAAAPDGVRTR